MSQSFNYAQRAFPSRLDKMGFTIGILADHRMDRQRTTMQKIFVILVRVTLRIFFSMISAVFT